MATFSDSTNESGTSGMFHSCEGMKNLSQPPPYFYVHDDAYDKNTKEKFRAVMLAIAGNFSYVACQVDFCPWCGIQLTPYTRARSNTIATMQDQYRTYRKRHIKTGLVEYPLSFEQWQEMVREYDETDMLLPHARPEHIDSLFRRKQKLRERLGLAINVSEEGESNVDNHGDGQP